ncbi:MAG: purine-nucleoside phosphorylase [Eubacteriales bacterium]|nr:purine-nucleoside phosphorylase [Eubacteriales bacterium]
MDFKFYENIASEIKQRYAHEVEITIVLGSALDSLEDYLELELRLPYREIPGMLQTSNPAHKGEFLFGRLGGRRVLLCSGRFHSYEGYSLEESSILARLAKLLGSRMIFLSNAAGGVNTDFSPGELMLITDHIKFNGPSPLAGPNLPEFGTRFPDMSDTYSKRLQAVAREAASQMGIKLQEGVYFFMPGPQYETAAEIRAISSLGADAVGMSTVGEAIVARHAQLEVLGISLITNLATGLSPEPLSDDEVIAAGAKAREPFAQLIGKIIELA